MKVEVEILEKPFWKTRSMVCDERLAKALVAAKIARFKVQEEVEEQPSRGRRRKKQED